MAPAPTRRQRIAQFFRGLFRRKPRSTSQPQSATSQPQPAASQPSTTQQPPSQPPASQQPSTPTPGAPDGAASGAGAAPPSGAREEEFRDLEETEREIEEMRRREKEARKRREELERRQDRRQPGVKRLEDFPGTRTGFRYATWFKASGQTSGDEVKYNAAMLQEMDEVDGETIPAQFFSGALRGKVKWDGVVDRETLIAELNSRAPWDGDFRTLYPVWEYRYYIDEMVGGVVVNTWEWLAAYPPRGGKFHEY